MPRIDPSYLRQHIALSYLRTLGVPAECANSGRLFMNGALYGLYTNLERPDQAFITPIFPGEDHGDLWDGAWQLAIHQDEMGLPHPRLDAFWAAKTAPAIAEIADMDEALLEWASEAMLADADGYWMVTGTTSSTTTRRAGGSGSRTTSTRQSTGRPTSTRCTLGRRRRLVTAVAALHRRAQGLRVARALRGGASPQLRRLRGLSASRHGRSFRGADPRHGRRRSHAPFHVRGPPERGRLPAPVDRHARGHRARLARLPRLPDTALDADGDHRPFCMDCKDTDPTMYPGAAEICGDGIDQDCDGIDFTACK